MSQHDLRFGLICLVLVAAGGLVRLSSGWHPLHNAAVAQAVSSEPGGDATVSELRDSVLRFYQLVDDGRYQAAYRLCLENRWQSLSTGEYTVEGLATEDDFVETLNREMGGQGLGQNIIKIAVTETTPFTLSEHIPAARPELRTLSFLPAAYQVRDIYQVRVTGALSGRCSQWDWDESLLAARLWDGTSSQWRLLLPGKLDDRFPHYQEWFMERDPLAGRRVAQP